MSVQINFTTQRVNLTTELQKQTTKYYSLCPQKYFLPLLDVKC